MSAIFFTKLITFYGSFINLEHLKKRISVSLDIKILNYDELPNIIAFQADYIILAFTFVVLFQSM